MAVNVRKLTVIGTLGADAEKRFTPNGKAVTSFNVASNWKDDKGNEQTTWFRISWWGDLAHKVAEYLLKGKLVYVQGDLNPREFEHNGQNRMSLDVRADSVQMLSPRSEGDGAAAAPTKAALPSEEEIDDEVPF